ncbi:hypothetical protein EVAR_11341_1 [Eumeta japonica]|uniref:Uncharacterized protein n=1 Tax=Eumeta variegata TaxID=151549 RepID=A0A4C1U0T6_EUMVA|nr:hypothetical protein EVAR_11341_1 [Eumeta japonica]
MAAICPFNAGRLGSLKLDPKPGRMVRLIRQVSLIVIRGFVQAIMIGNTHNAGNITFHYMRSHPPSDILTQRPEVVAYRYLDLELGTARNQLGSNASHVRKHSSLKYADIEGFPFPETRLREDPANILFIEPELEEPFPILAQGGSEWVDRKGPGRQVPPGNMDLLWDILSSFHSVDLGVNSSVCGSYACTSLTYFEGVIRCLTIPSPSMFDVTRHILNFTSSSEVDYVNPKFVKWAKVTVMKFGRKSPYYINAEGEIVKSFGNNVSIDKVTYEKTCDFQFSFVVNEFLSNRYQPTLLQYQYKLCNFFEDPIIGALFVNGYMYNHTCPFPAGEYHLMNLTVPVDNFPFEVPFTWSSSYMKGRIDIKYFHSDTNEKIGSLVVHLTIKHYLNDAKSRKNDNGHRLHINKRDKEIGILEYSLLSHIVSHEKLCPITTLGRSQVSESRSIHLSIRNATLPSVADFLSSNRERELVDFAPNSWLRDYSQLQSYYKEQVGYYNRLRCRYTSHSDTSVDEVRRHVEQLTIRMMAERPEVLRSNVSPRVPR